MEEHVTFEMVSQVCLHRPHTRQPQIVSAHMTSISIMLSVCFNVTVFAFTTTKYLAQDTVQRCDFQILLGTIYKNNNPN
jgi:hypothetical protein